MDSFLGKIFIIPSLGKAVEIASDPDYWNQQEFKEKKSLIQPPNTLLCLNCHGHKYLFVYLGSGGIKINDVKIYNYDVMNDKINSASGKKYSKKNQMCEALGFKKSGWDTATPIIWL